MIGALACIDFGYSVVPSQSDKVDEGKLLDNPFDPRCTSGWLKFLMTSWADIPGCDDVDISAIAAAQFGFYMQVQKFYTAQHFSRSVPRKRIEELSDLIFKSIESDGGYISAAACSF